MPKGIYKHIGRPLSESHKIKTREDLEQNWNEWYGKRNYGQFAKLNQIGGSVL